MAGVDVVVLVVRTRNLSRSPSSSQGQFFYGCATLRTNEILRTS
jgi:hypothetical protein